MQPTAMIEIEHCVGNVDGMGVDTLKLVGIIDIFEAERLHRQALDLLNAERVRALVLDLSGVERMDVSAVQILCALKQGFARAERPVNVYGITVPVAQSLALLGITL